MSDYQGFLQFTIGAARAAGQVIREGAQGEFNARQKGARDFVTDVDLAAERTIVEAIRRRYPDHDILTEETPPGARTSRYQWIIDPLDGTGNFVHHFPHFSTSIALAIDDEPIIGAVYDPMRVHLFAGGTGLGATLNGHPLHVCDNANLIDAQIGMDWSRDERVRRQIVNAIAQLTPHSGSIRCCGSAALGLCYVAAGWWDAYFHLQLSAWDVAAGAVIVGEAGGLVTDAAGQRWRPGEGPVLASNGAIHERFRELVGCGIDSA
ncbi:MAG: inositol monophosphatase [Anaerolineae bacterium]|nr:inositol monophosphatase [Anaerolineae bacterium]